jgi:ribosome-associated toxin RatA of RatAB toxin-antitoxin module
MADHSATVTVNAPVHQVYQLYSHFNDYPKFMTFVKEVTYLDDQRSHWVVDVVGKHEWDAVNEDWIPDRQIGWRSVDGLSTNGRVAFEPLGTGQTRVTVFVAYEPPAGLLGRVGEALGAGSEFERRLQHDLSHFAAMVEQAPAGALDPTSSSYLFHEDSAASKGRTTLAQDESMGMSGDTARETLATPAEATPSTTTVSSSGGGTGTAGGGSTQSELLTDPTVPRIPGTSANPQEQP